MKTLNPPKNLPKRFRGLRRVSREQVESWQPCYVKEDPELWAECLARFRKTTDARVVLRKLRGKIPEKDLLWLLLRDEWWESPEALLRWFAADCAAAALALILDPDPRSTNAVRVARLYAVGKVGAAAWDAAGAAAWDAAGAAAGAAAWAAARAAARAAAWDAAGDAARAAARAEQVSILAGLAGL